MKSKNATILVMGFLFLVGCWSSGPAFAVHVVAWGANNQGQSDVPEPNEYYNIGLLLVD